jgi:hypothetical protein
MLMNRVLFVQNLMVHKTNTMFFTSTPIRSTQDQVRKVLTFLYFYDLLLEIAF